MNYTQNRKDPFVASKDVGSLGYTLIPAIVMYEVLKF